MSSTTHMPKINYREDAVDSTSPYAIYTCKLVVDGQEVLTDPEGYILDMDAWSEGFARAQAAMGQVKDQIGYDHVLEDTDVAKISVVGVGMRSHAGIANTMFQALAGKGINIQVISTSEIKVSVLIAAEYTELAVRALHTAYGLDAS